MICVASMEAGPTLASFGWRAITVVRPQIAAVPTTTGGYDSCAHVGAPFKTKMSSSVGFHSCLPVTKKFRMKKRAGQSLTLNYDALVSRSI